MISPALVRAGWLAVTAAAVGLAGCAKPGDVTEAGALLLRLTVPSGASVPDELRVWAYDDGGQVFTNARIPSEGSLKPAQAAGPELGTVLIQPGVTRGTLRLHVRGLQAGAPVVEGAARVPAEARMRGRFDLALLVAVPGDGDADGVPDSIDDCPAERNPEQTGCADGGAGDAGSATDAAAPSSDGAGGNAAGGNGGTGGGTVGGSGGNASASGGRAASGGITGGAGGATASGGRSGSGGTGSGGTGSGGTGSGGTSSGGSGALDGGAGDTRPADAQAMEVAKKALGAACGAANECASAFCADSICCQSACNQPCQACNNQGRCNDVTRADDVPECSGTKTCNSRGACVAN